MHYGGKEGTLSINTLVYVCLSQEKKKQTFENIRLKVAVSVKFKNGSL